MFGLRSGVANAGRACKARSTHGGDNLGHAAIRTGLLGWKTRAAPHPPAMAGLRA